MATPPFTLDDIAAAYESTGLKPMGHRFMDPGYACPLGALAIARGGSLQDLCKATSRFVISRRLDITQDQVHSFTAGFDWHMNADDEIVGDGDFADLGREARKRFLPASIAVGGGQ